MAFLGIGAMGLPMARSLAAAGYPLTVWNRTLAKADALSSVAEVAPEPPSAVDGADIVVLMLESGPVVEHVLFELAAAESMKPGAVVVDMSSSSPELSRMCATRLKSRGVSYVDAPVSGGTKGAASGELAIFVGGDVDAVERCMPVLEVLGSPTRMGDVGAGQAAKLVNQVIVGVTIGAVVEGLSLGQALGVDLEAAHKALQQGFADSRILREHGRRILTRDFTSGAAMRIQTKDMRNALSAAENSSTALPLVELILREYEALEDRGHSELDHSALWLWYQSQDGPAG